MRSYEPVNNEGYVITEVFGPKRCQAPITEVDSPDLVLDTIAENPTHVVVVRGLDFKGVLDKARQHGPILEVAGPTPEGYRFAEKFGIERNMGKLLISNIWRNETGVNDSRRMRIRRRRKDYIADAYCLPHPDASVGGVLMSDWHGQRYPHTFAEASDEPLLMQELSRVLQPGGFLMTNRGVLNFSKLYYAAEAGLVPIALQFVKSFHVASVEQRSDTVPIEGILYKPPVSTE